MKKRRPWWQRLDKIGDIVMTGNRPRDESLNITAFFMKKGAGQLVDGTVYLDANLDESLFLTPVDTTKRDFRLHDRLAV